MRKQIRVLIHKAETAPFGRNAGHIDVAEPNGARANRKESGDRFEERGLARAGWADDDAVRAGRHGEAHVVEREIPETYRQRLYADHRPVRRRAATREAPPAER